MRDKVLIITSKNDEHADYIINLMNIRGMSNRVIRLNTEDFRMNLIYQFNGCHFDIRILDSGLHFTDEEIYSVWYRRPLEEKIELPDEGVRQFIRSQIKQFLNGMYYCLHDTALWINDLRTDLLAKNKLYQLYVAYECGFNVPDALISNDPEQVLSFFERNDKVCNKSLSVPRYEYDGREYPYMTRIVKKEEINNNLDSLDACPTFFEKFIEKEYDIRVVVIGESIFAFAMYSQENELSKVDVRGLSPLKIRHEYIVLPDDIQYKLQDFIKKQNLIFSSIDLIYSRDGKYYFVENNCNGQWLWLENITQVDMSSCFIRLLTGKDLD